MTKSEGKREKVDIVVFTMPQQLAIKKSWCLCWPANDCNSSLSCLEVGALGRRRKKFFGAIIFGLGKKQLWEEEKPFCLFCFSFRFPRFWLVLLQEKGEVARRAHQKDNFPSNNSWRPRNKATVANTFVFWMFPKVSPNYYSDFATQPPGILCWNEKFGTTFMWRLIAFRFMTHFGKA